MRVPPAVLAVLEDGLALLKKKDHYNFFSSEITPEIAPDYHEIIKQPIALCNMEDKLKRGDYTTLVDMTADVELLVRNCQTYNPPETQYHKEAGRLLEAWRARLPRLEARIALAVAKTAGSGSAGGGAATVAKAASETEARPAPTAGGAATGAARKPGRPRSRRPAAAAANSAAGDDEDAGGDSDGVAAVSSSMPSAGAAASGRRASRAPDSLASRLDGEASHPALEPLLAVLRTGLTGSGHPPAAPRPHMERDAKAIRAAMSEAVAQLRRLAAGETPPPPAHVLEARARHAVAVALGAPKDGYPTRGTVPSTSGAAVPVSFLQPAVFDPLEPPKVPSVQLSTQMPQIGGTRVQKPRPSDYALEDSVWCCHVCGDSSSGEGNSLLQCDNPACAIVVHQGCYGVQELPDGEWYCDPCAAGLHTRHVPCALCCTSGGPLKPTEAGLAYPQSLGMLLQVAADTCGPVAPLSAPNWYRLSQVDPLFSASGLPAPPASSEVIVSRRHRFSEASRRRKAASKRSKAKKRGGSAAAAPGAASAVTADVGAASPVPVSEGGAAAADALEAGSGSEASDGGMEDDDGESSGGEGGVAGARASTAAAAAATSSTAAAVASSSAVTAASSSATAAAPHTSLDVSHLRQPDPAAPVLRQPSGVPLHWIAEKHPWRAPAGVPVPDSAAPVAPTCGPTSNDFDGLTYVGAMLHHSEAVEGGGAAASSMADEGEEGGATAAADAVSAPPATPDQLPRLYAATPVPGQWAHVICGLNVPDVYFGDYDALSPVMGIEKVDQRRAVMTCRLCHKAGGAIIQCTYGMCGVPFHAQCATALCNYMGHVEDPKTGLLRRVAHCGKHDSRAPSDLTRIPFADRLATGRVLAMATAGAHFGKLLVERDRLRAKLERYAKRKAEQEAARAEGAAKLKAVTAGAAGGAPDVSAVLGRDAAARFAYTGNAGDADIDTVLHQLMLTTVTSAPAAGDDGDDDDDDDEEDEEEDEEDEEGGRVYHTSGRKAQSQIYKIMDYDSASDSDASDVLKLRGEDIEEEGVDGENAGPEAAAIAALLGGAAAGAAGEEEAEDEDGGDGGGGSGRAGRDRRRAPPSALLGAAAAAAAAETRASSQAMMVTGSGLLWSTSTPYFLKVPVERATKVLARYLRFRSDDYRSAAWLSAEPLVQGPAASSTGYGEGRLSLAQVALQAVGRPYARLREREASGLPSLLPPPDKAADVLALGLNRLGLPAPFADEKAWAAFEASEERAQRIAAAAAPFPGAPASVPHVAASLTAAQTGLGVVPAAAEAAAGVTGGKVFPALSTAESMMVEAAAAVTRAGRVHDADPLTVRRAAESVLRAPGAGGVHPVAEEAVRSAVLAATAVAKGITELAAGADGVIAAPSVVRILQGAASNPAPLYPSFVPVPLAELDPRALAALHYQPHYVADLYERKFDGFDLRDREAGPLVGPNGPLVTVAPFETPVLVGAADPATGRPPAAGGSAAPLLADALIVPAVPASIDPEAEAVDPYLRAPAIDPNAPPALVATGQVGGSSTRQALPAAPPPPAPSPKRPAPPFDPALLFGGWGDGDDFSELRKVVPAAFTPPMEALAAAAHSAGICKDTTFRFARPEEAALLHALNRVNDAFICKEDFAVTIRAKNEFILVAVRKVEASNGRCEEHIVGFVNYYMCWFTDKTRPAGERYPPARITYIATLQAVKEDSHPDLFPRTAAASGVDMTSSPARRRPTAGTSTLSVINSPTGNRNRSGGALPQAEDAGSAAAPPAAAPSPRQRERDSNVDAIVAARSVMVAGEGRPGLRVAPAGSVPAAAGEAGAERPRAPGILSPPVQLLHTDAGRLVPVELPAGPGAEAEPSSSTTSSIAYPAAPPGAISSAGPGSKAYYPFTTHTPGAAPRTGTLLLCLALAHAQSVGMGAALVDSTDSALPYYLNVVRMSPLNKHPGVKYNPMYLSLADGFDPLAIALPLSLWRASQGIAPAPASAARGSKASKAAAAAAATSSSQEAPAPVPPAGPEDDEIYSEVCDVVRVLAALRLENDEQARRLLARIAAEDERRSDEAAVAIRRRQRRTWTIFAAYQHRKTAILEAERRRTEEDMDACCAICGSGDSYPKNAIVFCDKCNVPVHQGCYGVPSLPDADWYCDPCSKGMAPSTLTCALCPVRGGALRPVAGGGNARGAGEGSDSASGGAASASASSAGAAGAGSHGEWCHVVCARLFAPQVRLYAPIEEDGTPGKDVVVQGLHEPPSLLQTPSALAAASAALATGATALLSKPWIDLHTVGASATAAPEVSPAAACCVCGLSSGVQLGCAVPGCRGTMHALCAVDCGLVAALPPEVTIPPGMEGAALDPTNTRFIASTAPPLHPDALAATFKASAPVNPHRRVHMNELAALRTQQQHKAGVAAGGGAVSSCGAGCGHDHGHLRVDTGSDPLAAAMAGLLPTVAAAAGSSNTPSSSAEQVPTPSAAAAEAASSGSFATAAASSGDNLPPVPSWLGSKGAAAPSLYAFCAAHRVAIPGRLEQGAHLVSEKIWKEWRKVLALTTAADMKRKEGGSAAAPSASAASPEAAAAASPPPAAATAAASEAPAAALDVSMEEEGTGETTGASARTRTRAGRGAASAAATSSSSSGDIAAVLPPLPLRERMVYTAFRLAIDDEKVFRPTAVVDTAAAEALAEAPSRRAAASSPAAPAAAAEPPALSSPPAAIDLLDTQADLASPKRDTAAAAAAADVVVVLGDTPLAGRKRGRSEERVVSSSGPVEVALAVEATPAATAAPQLSATATSPVSPLTDASEADPLVCAVCGDGDSEPENVILLCDGCDIPVHQSCYGVTHVPQGDEQWRCEPCAAGKRRADLSCALCPGRDGALKPTERGLAAAGGVPFFCDEWAHVTCVLWVPETSFGDADRMTPVAGMELVPRSRWNLKCRVCKRDKEGAPIQCSHGSCTAAFHVSCGMHAKGYYFDYREEGAAAAAAAAPAAGKRGRKKGSGSGGDAGGQRPAKRSKKSEGADAALIAAASADGAGEGDDDDGDVIKVSYCPRHTLDHKLAAESEALFKVQSRILVTLPPPPAPKEKAMPAPAAAAAAETPAASSSSGGAAADDVPRRGGAASSSGGPAASPAAGANTALAVLESASVRYPPILALTSDPTSPLFAPLVWTLCSMYGFRVNAGAIGTAKVVHDRVAPRLVIPGITGTRHASTHGLWDLPIATRAALFGIESSGMGRSRNRKRDEAQKLNPCRRKPVTASAVVAGAVNFPEDPLGLEALRLAELEHDRRTRDENDDPLEEEDDDEDMEEVDPRRHCLGPAALYAADLRAFFGEAGNVPARAAVVDNRFANSEESTASRTLQRLQAIEAQLADITLGGSGGGDGSTGGSGRPSKRSRSSRQRGDGEGGERRRGGERRDRRDSRRRRSGGAGSSGGGGDGGTEVVITDEQGGTTVTTLEDASARYCICRRTYSEDSSVMVGCEKCEEWYHIGCLSLRICREHTPGYTAEQEEAGEAPDALSCLLTPEGGHIDVRRQYYCPRCSEVRFGTGGTSKRR